MFSDVALIVVRILFDEEVSLPIDVSSFQPFAKKPQLMGNNRDKGKGILLVQTPQNDRAIVEKAIAGLLEHQWRVYQASYKLVEHTHSLRFYLGHDVPAQLPLEGALMNIVGNYAFSVQVLKNPDHTMVLVLGNTEPRDFAQILNAGRELSQIMLVGEKFTLVS